MGEQRSIRETRGVADSDAEGVTGVEAPARRHSPWTQVEHLLFLLGLDDHGRGAWRAIAMDYCISRTPTQVASHAQKYFLRQELTPSRRHKKRPSIHDITRASISPYATSSERDHMRVTLQETVRSGRDMAGAADSNDNSASSSGKSASCSCLPVSDPIFGQVFAFTVDNAGTTNSPADVDVTFGVAGAQQVKYTAMHPMHHPPATTGPAGASWGLPGGALLAPMHMAPGMQLQPTPYPGPMHIVAPHPQLAHFTPVPGVPWPQAGHVPAMPHSVAARVPRQPGPTAAVSTTGPIASFTTRCAAGYHSQPAAGGHGLASQPAFASSPALPVYPPSMASGGWLAAPSQPAVAPGPDSPSNVTGGASLAVPPPQHAAPMPEPVVEDSASAAAQGSQPPPQAPAHPSQQAWQYTAQLLTDGSHSTPASSGSDKAGSMRGTKRDGEVVQDMMHGQQPWQYLAQWQPPEQAPPAASAAPAHRHGLAALVRPGASAREGPPSGRPQVRAAVTTGDFSNSVQTLDGGVIRALAGVLSEPMNALGGSSSGSGAGVASSTGSFGVAWRSTVPECGGGDTCSTSSSMPMLTPLDGDAIKWSGMHGMQMPMQAMRNHSDSSLQLPHFAPSQHQLAALPPPPATPPGSAPLETAPTQHAQMRSPGMAPAADGARNSQPHRVHIGRNPDSGRELLPQGLPFQPFAHEAGAWSAHAADALGPGSLQESGDGIVDYLLGNMPLLADPLLDADVFDRSSSGSTDSGGRDAR